MQVLADQIPDGSVLDCDLCIIGAGAAGITISHSLLTSKLNVIMVDSGEEGLSARAQALEAGESIGVPYWPLDRVRLRMLGGSTNHWEGTCNAFDEIDFVKRPWIEHSGWPIKKRDLADHYKRAQAYVQIGPYDYSFSSWCQRLGVAMPEWFGHQLVGKVTQHSPPTRFGEVYGPDLAKSSNVRVLLRATALKMNMSRDSATAESILVGRYDRAPFTIRARRFVLATGGIENARFLLLNNLGNRSGTVGRYFMEHPYFRLMLLAPSQQFLQFSSLWESRYFHDVQISPEIQFSESTLWKDQFQNSRLAFESTDRYAASAGVEAFHEIASGGVNSADEMLYHIGNLLLDVDLMAEAVNRRKRATDLFAKSSEIVGYTIGCMTEQVPNPDSRILLSDRRDEFGQRRVKVDLQLTDTDRLSAGRMVKAISQEFGRVGIGRVRSFVPDRFEPWPPHRISYGAHHMGTTRMSSDPKQGVVNTNLRLHDVANVYVAGSSVFPTGSHVPPTLTLVAFALRLADYLRTTTP